MVRSLIVCRSRSHGNTARVAHAIADVLDARVVEPTDIAPQDIAEYDLVGFGSGIYAFSFDPELRRFAASLSRCMTSAPSCSRLPASAVSLNCRYGRRSQRWSSPPAIAWSGASVVPASTPGFRSGSWAA
jgi:menaquinone-dependent protoporphyrinogen IX oxidase